MTKIGTTGEDNFLSHVERVRREIQDKLMRTNKVLQETVTIILKKLNKTMPNPQNH